MALSAPHPPLPLRRRSGLPLVPAVLVVLIGLLGMHALAPGGGMAGHPEHVHAAHRGVVATAQDACPGGDGSCGGHRMDHADPACVSGAVKGGPELPALVPHSVAAAVPARAARTWTGTAPDGARAPPSLAELQLLRI